MKKRQFTALLMSFVLVLAMMPWTAVVDAKAASSPKLAKKSMKIYVGKTAKVKVRNKPRGAKLIFKSSNKRVAAVSKKGKVKGKRAGKATIRISVRKNGKTIKKLKCKVTVRKKKKRLDNPKPTAVAVKNSCHTVSFDSKGGSAVGSQTVADGKTARKPDDPVRDKYYFDGWYKDSQFLEKFDFATPIKSDITIYAKWIEDSDNDKVSNVVEDILGTSTGKGDTDGDKISDYIEIYEIGSDPLVADSDGDTDGDGLSNLDEVARYGTSGGLKDTDGDGLDDYEEVVEYETSPLKGDTDGDGISDGDEVTAGTNPLVRDELKKVEQRLSDSVLGDDLLEENVALPSIYGHADYVLDREVQVSKTAENALHDNRAIVGQGIDVAIPSDADLSVSFDIPGDAENPIIMKYSDAGWEAQNTELEGTQVVAKLAGSGTYCVMDLSVLLPSLGVDVTSYYDVIMGKAKSGRRDSSVKGKSQKSNNDASGNVRLDQESKSILNGADRPRRSSASRKSSVSGQVDIVFVVDTTGSMTDVISNVANNIIEFSDVLVREYNVNANFSLVDYKDITEDGKDATKIVKNGTSNWFTETVDFQREVGALAVDGGGDLPETPIDALECARRLHYRTGISKHIVLVTDAGYKVDNGYGVSSMQEEIELLKNNGMTVSVVTNSDARDEYQDLYEGTGGFYANIGGDFSQELLRIADMIGEDANAGNWILLDDFQYVSLENPLGPGSGDTDHDGKSDYEELKEPVQMDVAFLLKMYLVYRKVPRKAIEDHFRSGNGPNITVYPYHSNPVLADTDYDGIGDGEDDHPRNGRFDGEFLGYENVRRANYQLDFRDFFQSSKVYHDRLARASLVFANTIYSDCGFKYSDGREIKDVAKLLKYHGFDEVADYKLSDHYHDDDISEIGIGYHDVTYAGRTRRVIAVVVRGTNGTIEEWSSNFDMGDPDEWDFDEHKGFHITEERIESYVNAYVKKINKGKTAECEYWITGHSRGAALSNLLAVRLVDAGNAVYAYTFAAPSTTISTSKSNDEYDCIFNFANTSDVVTCVPLPQWGFGRYGITKDVSVEDSGLGRVWASQTGHKQYNAMNKNLIQVALNRIYSSCCRTWSQVFDRSGVQLIGEDKYKCITDREFRYCDVTDIKFFEKHLGYGLYPSAAFVFQLGAEFLGGNQSDKDKAFELVKELWNSKYGAVALLLLGDEISYIKHSVSHMPKEFGESLVGDGHAPATYYILLDAVR